LGCATGGSNSSEDGPSRQDHRIQFPDGYTPPDGGAHDGALDAKTPTGSITVTAPAGGETWPAGSTQNVAWTWTANVGPAVDIELWKGSAKAADIATAQSNTGSFSWDIPAGTPWGDDYTVRISDPVSAAVGISPAPFTIDNWRYRVKVTLTSAKSLTSYQVPLDLDPTSFTYANAAANGADLRFASSSTPGTFDVPHFVESWDSTKQSRIWILAASISTSQPTVVYLFYGNPGATSKSSKKATFPNQLVTTGDVTLSGSKSYDWFELKQGHTLTLGSGNPLSISAPRIIIAGAVEGSGKGYGGGVTSGKGKGTGGGAGTSTSGGGGAGYGGKGGQGGHDSADTPAAGGVTYGSASSSKVEMGSGGGAGNTQAGGAGGGALTLDGLAVSVSGSIKVNGLAGEGGAQSGGGGSGGGIMIRAESVVLSGSCTAKGGKGGSGSSTANDGGGGGGGGRVKLFYGSLSNTGTVTTSGGAGGKYGDASHGVPGVSGTFTKTKQVVNPVSVTFGPEETIQ
jgi:hypothetical protein